MLTATRTNGHEVRVHNRLQYARWEHKQARLGAGLGMLAAVVGASLVFTLANVLADNGLSPFGPSQQVVSSASPLPSLSQGARP